MVSRCVQNLQSPVSEQCLVNLVIVQDVSGSITDPNNQNIQNWRDSIDFLDSIVQSLQIDADHIQVGLTFFGNE